MATAYNLYTEVQLTKDFPDLGFIKGDVATIIDIIPTPEGRNAYCLEFFDNHGNTLQVAIVAEADIKTSIKTLCSKLPAIREIK